MPVSYTYMIVALAAWAAFVGLVPSSTVVGILFRHILCAVGRRAETMSSQRYRANAQRWGESLLRAMDDQLLRCIEPA